MKARLLGAAVAVLVTGADQAAKAFAVRELEGLSVAFTPVVNLTLAHNKGISFSLFADAPEAARWALLAFTLTAVAALGVWLARTRAVLAAVGLGAILGGAVGNGIDRFLQGSVVDFLDLHLGERHFFVFNLADAAINLGVALLLLDAFFGGRRESTP